MKIKPPVDARHVPEAGYGNLADGGNVMPSEAEAPFLHPPPICFVEGDINQRVSYSLPVAGSKGSPGFFESNRMRLLVNQLPHNELLATLQRMRHNTGITRRAAPLLPMTAVVSAVGCMPLLYRGRR